MALTFELDPTVDGELRVQLAALWARVTNAGGAVGLVPPVVDEDVLPDVDRHLAAVAEGRTRLLLGREDGRPAATAFLAFNTHRLMRHWAWLYTVMVDPELQGRGHGAALLREAEERARGLGLEGLRLTCRGGLGLENFYASAGYKEVGRAPAAIRVADGDDRDEITMWLPL